MKKMFLEILLLTIVFVSCQEPSVYEKQVSAEEQALKSNEKIDTIFLGFRFGMTPKEFDMHLFNLAKEKKVASDENGFYYLMKGLSSNEYRCYIKSEYHDDRLYQLRVFAKPETSVSLCVNEMALNIIRKYQLGELLKEPNNGLTDCEGRILYKGNLKVHVFCNIHDEAIVEYTDIVTYKMLQVRKDSLDKEREKQGIKDF